jgi:hypothetical protein
MSEERARVSTELKPSAFPETTCWGGVGGAGHRRSKHLGRILGRALKDGEVFLAGMKIFWKSFLRRN